MNIVQGDYGFDLNFTLTEDGAAMDLTSATVTFKMGTIIDEECVIDSEAGGTCHYTIANGDTDTIGDFSWELEVAYAGKVITAKGSDYIHIISQL